MYIHGDGERERDREREKKKQREREGKKPSRLNMKYPKKKMYRHII